MRDSGRIARPALLHGVRSVKDFPFGTHAELSARDNELIHDGLEARNYPTPAEFVRQFSKVIAYCLGFAVLAHVIVALVGT
jgi:hypothetical protein